MWLASLIIFPMVIFYTFFSFLWWLGGWSFGVWVLNRVFGVGVFCWWGLGPVVLGLLGFFGVGALYIIIEE